MITGFVEYMERLFMIWTQIIYSPWFQGNNVVSTTFSAVSVKASCTLAQVFFAIQAAKACGMLIFTEFADVCITSCIVLATKKILGIQLR